MRVNKVQNNAEAYIAKRFAILRVFQSDAVISKIREFVHSTKHKGNRKNKLPCSKETI